MDTRTFRAATMLEALQAVQKELGSDALVVSMRETETGLWHKPCCEIVAARPSIKTPPTRAAQPAPAPAEMKAEPKPAPMLAPTTIDPALKESLAAMIREATAQIPPAVKETPVKAPAPLAQPAAHTKTSHPAAAPANAAAAKISRPFTPEVLSSRASTRTWIVTDEEAREDFAAAAAPEKPGLKPAPARVESAKPALKPAPAREETARLALAPTAVVVAEAPKLAPAPEIEDTSALARMRMHLLNQGLEPGLVERLNRACAETLSPSRLEDGGYLSNFLKRQLLVNLRPAAKLPGDGRKVVCLIGASGSGKTSTCAKLAAHYALQEGKKVAWIEANTVRTGAIAEARMITESLGVDLHLVYGPEDLSDALINTQDADLVLMDTAGCNPRREASLIELGELITSLPQRLTLLVTAATTKDADLRQSLAAFKPFSLDGLVVTRMDETLTFGSIYNHASQSKLPVAFYTSDPAAMSGLNAGDGEYLVNAMFNEGI